MTKVGNLIIGSAFLLTVIAVSYFALVDNKWW